MENPLFQIGQKVQPNDGHLPSVIIGITGNADGWVYSVAAKAFNLQTEEVTDGVRHYGEAELTEYVEEAEPTEEEQIQDEE